MWKRENTAPKEQFLLFSTIFSIYLLTSGVILHNHLWNIAVQFIFFLNSANMICWGMDISKYFRESLDWHNESQLYLFMRLKNCWISGKQCRSWSEAAFCLLSPVSPNILGRYGNIFSTQNYRYRSTKFDLSLWPLHLTLVLLNRYSLPLQRV